MANYKSKYSGEQVDAILSAAQKIALSSVPLYKGEGENSVRTESSKAGIRGYYCNKLILTSMDGTSYSLFPHKTQEETNNEMGDESIYAEYEVGDVISIGDNKRIYFNCGKITDIAHGRIDVDFLPIKAFTKSENLVDTDRFVFVLDKPDVGISTVGNYAISLAKDGLSLGKYSSTEGLGTVAVTDEQHVQGRYNLEDTEGKFAHVLGNGTSDADRSNAHTVDWDGNAWYAGKVAVGKDKDILATEKVVQAIVDENNTVSRIVSPDENGNYININDDLFEGTYILDGTFYYNTPSNMPTGEMIFMNCFALVKGYDTVKKVITFGDDNINITTYNPDNVVPEILSASYDALVAQPDWNQTDETQANYIKNKPFYEETEIIGESEIYGYENGCTLTNSANVEEGETLFYEVDEPTGMNSGSFVAHYTEPGVRQTINDEYVYYLYNYESNNYLMFWKINEATVDTPVRVYRKNVKQIDEKYIPNTIARTADLPEPLAYEEKVFQGELVDFQGVPTLELKTPIQVNDKFQFEYTLFNVVYTTEVTVVHTETSYKDSYFTCYMEAGNTIIPISTKAPLTKMTVYKYATLIPEKYIPDTIARKSDTEVEEWELLGTNADDIESQIQDGDCFVIFSEPIQVGDVIRITAESVPGYYGLDFDQTIIFTGDGHEVYFNDSPAVTIQTNRLDGYACTIYTVYKQTKVPIKDKLSNEKYIPDSIARTSDVEANTKDIADLNELRIKPTASGEMISLTDSAERPFESMRIFGKSEQLSTTGKNKFNNDTSLLKEITYAGESGNLTRIGYEPLQLPAGTYTFTLTDLDTSITKYVYGVINDSDGNFVQSSNLLQDKVNLTPLTITVNEGDKIYIYNAHASLNISDRAAELSKVQIQLEPGSTSTKYEPYTGGIPSPNPNYPQEIVSVGDSGSVEQYVCGKNIFDADEVYGAYLNADGSYTASAAQTYSIKNHFEKTLVGKTITISATMKRNDTTVNNLGISVRKPDDTIIAREMVVEPDNYKKVSITFTLQSKDAFWCLDYGTGANTSITFKEVLLEVGSVATPYEPPKHQSLTLSTPNGLHGVPVSSGGNYTDENGQQYVCDEVDLERGVYVQWVATKEVYINSTLTLSNGIPVGIASGYFDKRQVTAAGALADKAIYVRASSYVKEANQFYENVNSFGFSGENDDTLTTLRDKFNGTIITYILEEPIETPLSEEEIEAYKSLHTNYPVTTIYNSDGAGTEVKYVADTKLYIDNKFAELQANILSATE